MHREDAGRMDEMRTCCGHSSAMALVARAARCCRIRVYITWERTEKRQSTSLPREMWMHSTHRRYHHGSRAISGTMVTAAAPVPKAAAMCHRCTSIAAVVGCTAAHAYSPLNWYDVSQTQIIIKLKKKRKFVLGSSLRVYEKKLHLVSIKKYLLWCSGEK